MTELDPDGWQRETIFLDAAPQVLALYRSSDDERYEGEIIGYVFLMPDGEIIIQRKEGKRRDVVYCDSLDGVEKFWAALMDAELVNVRQKD